MSLAACNLASHNFVQGVDCSSMIDSALLVQVPHYFPCMARCLSWTSTVEPLP